MSQGKAKTPNLTDDGAAQRREREARLAEALRDNLKKRKEQARGRATEHGDSRVEKGPGEP